jgi:hypothetical protein
VDYVFKRQLFPGRSSTFYLRSARASAFSFVFLSYLLTRQFTTLVEFIEVISSFLGFVAVPLYFGVIWRKANRKGMWAALLVGILLFVMTRFWLQLRFQYTVFVPTFGSALMMYLVSRLTRSEPEVMLNRFYCTLNTPLGQEAKLEAVGIRLPSMMANLAPGDPEPPEQIDERALAHLYQEQSVHKVFGPENSLEILSEPGLGWYYRGFVLITLACTALLVATWLGSRLLGSLSLAK